MPFNTRLPRFFCRAHHFVLATFKHSCRAPSFRLKSVDDPGSQNQSAGTLPAPQVLWFGREATKGLMTMKCERRARGLQGLR